MRKRVLKILTAALVCVLSLIMFSGCRLFDNLTSLSAVRERADALRHEMSGKIVNCFKNNDADAVIALFCPKTQALPDIKEQVKPTLAFMEGGISEYKVSRTTGYEGSSIDGGKVTEFSFGNDVYITTETGKKYDLYMSFNYIADDDSIEGLTSYSIIEYGLEETGRMCRAGYNWSSPCDGEIGILAAGLINAIGSGDAATLKSLLCPQIRRVSDLDSQIAKVFKFFEGAPTFTERVDGLYNYLYGDDALNINTIGYDGNADTAWTSAIASPVCTDAGKKYRLHFVAYLKHSDADKRGVSWFSLEEYFEGDNEVQLGEWLH